MKPLFFALAALLLMPAAGEDDVLSWDRFRGPNGSGLDLSRELPVTWGERHRRWVTPIPGRGHGSPVIWGNRIFLLTAVPAEGAEDRPKGEGKGKGAPSHRWMALALSRLDGAILWQREFSPRRFRGHRFNSAASSTPAVDGERVVFSWGTPDELTLVALDHEGKLLWEKEMGPVAGGHGFGASPIIHGELVVLNNDQDDEKGNLFALDAATGEVAWTVPRRSRRISYSVPCVYRGALVFVNWRHGFTAVRPGDGSVIDEASVFNLDTAERAISSPIVAGDLVIGTCGFTANPKHCVAMKLENDRWNEVWRIERNVPHIPSVIAVNGFAFLWDDSGIVTCVRAETGESLWRERLPGMEGRSFGSPVSDGRHIFCADESGNIHVISATGEYRYLGSNPLGEPCKTTPALAGGQLFVRTETQLHAIGP